MKGQTRKSYVKGPIEMNFLDRNDYKRSLFRRVTTKERSPEN